MVLETAGVHAARGIGKLSHLCHELFALGDRIEIP
jgi:hypothetical protein